MPVQTDDVRALRLCAHFLLEQALALLDDLGEQHVAIDVDMAINKLGFRMETRMPVSRQLDRDLLK